MIGDRTVVFLGFSCSAEEAREILPDALYLPPASCGDIIYALRLKPRRIAIVDGVFGHAPSVWHKEILFALSNDVEIWGAASMGALRAAELDAFGMKGFGQVFRWFKDDTLTDDDEVALLYVETDAGYELVADPMVNIRATVQCAIDDGVMSSSHGERVVRDLKALHYSKRRLDEYLRPSTYVEDRAFRDWLSEGRYIDMKRRDATDLLRHLQNSTAQNVDATPVQMSLSLRRLLLRAATTALPFSGIPLSDCERQLQLIAAKPIFPSLRRLALLFAFFDGWLRCENGAHALDALLGEYARSCQHRPPQACAEHLSRQIRSRIPLLRLAAEPEIQRAQTLYKACLRLDGTYSSFQTVSNGDVAQHEMRDGLYHRILVLVSSLWRIFQDYLEASGLAPNAASVEKYVVEFRRERRLSSEKDMRSWLHENDLTLEEARRFFSECSIFSYLIEGCFFEQFGFLDVAYERNWLLYAAKVVAPQEFAHAR